MSEKTWTLTLKDPDGREKTLVVDEFLLLARDTAGGIACAGWAEDRPATPYDIAEKLRQGMFVVRDAGVPALKVLAEAVLGTFQGWAEAMKKEAERVEEEPT